MNIIIGMKMSNMKFYPNRTHYYPYIIIPVKHTKCLIYYTF